MVNVFDVVDICKVDDNAHYSFKKVDESSAGFALVKFVIKQKSVGRTTFAVSQRGCKTEEAEGNFNFDQNSYSRRVDSTIVKLIDPKKGFADGNCQIVSGGKKERSPYALRDHYIEYQSFEAGTYYYYANIQWNG